MPNQAVIAIKLNKAFDGQPVVRDLNFAAEEGEILAVLGPSGCGKTTCLRLIAGFEQLDSGQIAIDGQVVAGNGHHLPTEKRRVGMVFQDYAIFPHLTVRENVAFGLSRGRAAKARTQEMIDLVGLAGHGDKMPHELSGGQQQRVALARALAPEPAVLLLDEPFSNLDAALRLEVRHEVRALLKRSGVTAIFVTHDQEEALFMGDRVAIMNDGRLEQIDTPETVYHEPTTRFVAEFVGQTDFLSGTVTEEGVETALGMLPQQLALPVGSQVDVAVRSDDVDFEPAGTANGKVLDRQFMGISYVYHVRLDNGQKLHSWQPHTLKLEPGTPIQVKLRNDHALTCFQDGRRI